MGGKESSVEKRNELVVQLMSILFAGHDTTTNLLAWITHFLSLRPDVQELIYKEISAKDIMDDDDLQHLRLEKLESCAWLNAVVNKYREREREGERGRG